MNKNKIVNEDNVGFVVMHRNEVVDIDTVDDWRKAEEKINVNNKLNNKNISKIKIGNRLIGTNEPCFIVAEAGVNHNGDLNLAKKLIDSAAEAGADAVKFQILTAAGLYVRDAGHFTTDWGEKHDIYEVWKKTEVPNYWIIELASYCKSKGVIFFSSAFDEETVDLLNPYVDVFKVASSETTHIPLLKKIAKTGKPIIFSIGGADIEEVLEAVKAVREEGNNNISILYCVPKYPTPFELANVKAIKSLGQQFPNVVIGYSDHSLNPDPITIPAAAVFYGAKIIEKHFTLDRKMEGIDHKMSMEPNEFKKMVQTIRENERLVQAGRNIEVNPILVGEGLIKPPEDLKKIVKFIRRTIFTVEEIKKGEYFTEENLRVLRPGNREASEGMHPREYLNILGKKANQDIPALSLIKDEHVS